MPDNAPTRAVIYAAKATEDRHGSIDTQIADCRAMAKHEGWEVIGEFQDEGASAWSGNRGPGLAEAIEEAERAAPSVLAVQHSDRIARGDAVQAQHLVEVVTWAVQAGVTIRSVQDDLFADQRVALLMGAAMGQRNTEDSARKSAAVRDGKDRQMGRGEWLGGKVQDGLLLRVERDGSDKVIARRLERDPGRAPILDRIFDLSEGGHTNGSIARTLNGEGHRTKPYRTKEGMQPPGLWTHRRVQDTLRNLIYAGRIERRTVGGKELPEPEIVTATNVEALIEPERFDRMAAARAAHDLTTPRAKRGGARTERYVLAKIGGCDRCGGRTAAVTSGYLRKDGTRKRSYGCVNRRCSTGVCDLPLLDAERIDTAVVAYLDDLFVDFDRWQEEVALARDGRRVTVEAELGTQRKRLEKAVRREAQLRERWLEAMGGDPLREQQHAEAHLSVIADRDDARQAVERIEAELASEPAPATDAMLDAWNDLRDAVRNGGSSLGELNERLRAEFIEFRMDLMPNGVIGIQPVLRTREFDVGAAYRDWVDGGKPDPTPEQIAEHDRERVGDEPIWVTGEEQIRPPAQALAVPAAKGRSPSA